MPAMLLQRSLQGPAGPGGANGDPARLRAAITALRHALKHPLTSHVSTKPSKLAVERPTKLQKVSDAVDGGCVSTRGHQQHLGRVLQMRQREIKPYSFVRGKVQGGGGKVAGLNVSRHHLRGLEGV